MRALSWIVATLLACLASARADVVAPQDAGPLLPQRGVARLIRTIVAHDDTNA